MTRLWLVRLGKNGEYEAATLRDNMLRIGFGLHDDISHLKDREALIGKMAELFPNDKPNRHKNFGAQVNQFVNVAQTGDLVVTPFKTTSTVSIGRLSGAYATGAKGEPLRPVEWLKTDLPRDSFKQDLLYSFGAFMTVCEISRNDALRRVQAVLETGRDPGDGVLPAASIKSPMIKPTADDEATEAADQPINLEQLARDQIERRIASVFTGHDFTRLVAAILSAQGYQTRVSPPGADAGVDIVAGNGPLGLDGPRVVAQVKSGSVTVDQPTLQGLIGSIQDTHADHGLVVSWGGFTSAVRRRTNELFFRVRLWGREELVNNLLAAYDRLPEDIRAELPLRRTWTLVLDDDGEVDA
ncbi:restriction endonuclease [Rhizobium leguminosarum]|uniref:restriction endonuclease n=1 Tax=Rhizobium TaxID=379 RepID=UPI0010324AEC|nr:MULTISPECIES: restriction endonuclease [Rhizobium]MBY5442717.1 restriction endonuclease [Rhizobium leguminosarum]TBA59663.1 restriction endonuclease [Rhizobium ruizarguesonis]